MKSPKLLKLTPVLTISLLIICAVFVKVHVRADVLPLGCAAGKEVNGSLQYRTPEQVGNPQLGYGAAGRGYSDANYNYRTYSFGIGPAQPYLPIGGSYNPYVGIMADCKATIDTPTNFGMRPVDAFLPTSDGLQANPVDKICDGTNNTGISLPTEPDANPPVYASDGCGNMQYAAVPDDGMAAYINSNLIMCLSMGGRSPANTNPADGVWQQCGTNLTNVVHPIDNARNPYGWGNGAGYAFSSNSCTSMPLRRSLNNADTVWLDCGNPNNTNWTQGVGVAGNTYFKLINGQDFNPKRSEFLSPSFRLRMAVFNSVPAGYNSRFLVTFKFPKPATIKGYVYTLSQSGSFTPEGGVKIQDCNGNTAATGSNGLFSMGSGYGMPFCLRPVNASKDGYIGPFIRPWGEGYPPSCTTGFNFNQASPNYCDGQGTYEWQVAGLKAGNDPSSHDPNENLQDRASNEGYDFVYVAATAPRCTLTTSANIEVGDSISILASANGAAGVSFQTQFNDGGLGLKNPIPNSVRIGSDGSWAQGTPITGTANAPGKYTVTLTFKAVDGTSNNCSTTIIIGNQPYLKVYGNDVAVGDKFAGASGQSCDVGTSRATVLTLGNTDLINYTGSSAQLGVFALGEIDQFFSGGMQSGSPEASSPAAGLTFGNFGGSAWQPVGYGGRSGISHCATDYFGILTAGQATPATTTNNLNANALGAFTYVKAPSTEPLKLLSGQFSGKKVLVVDGDVHIQNNVNYQGYSSVATMPSFYLVVKGKIFIDKSVTNLSGVYVAQPGSGADSGTIYTCSTSTNYVAASNLFSDCNQKLTINGAFIAKSVKFMRTNGTKKDSVKNENWDSPHIAEVFKSSPEMYLSVPTALSNASGSAGTYDSITSLPPIL